MWLLVPVLALVLGSSGPDGAPRCTCSGAQLPTLVEHADLVFIGRVVAARLVDEGRSGELPEYTLEVSAVFKGPGEPAVHRPDEGAIEAPIAVRTRWGGGDCGFPFMLGGSYVVFAHAGTEGVYYTDLCSGTASLYERVGQDREAALDELYP